NSGGQRPIDGSNRGSNSGLHAAASAGEASGNKRTASRLGGKKQRAVAGSKRGQGRLAAVYGCGCGAQRRLRGQGAGDCRGRKCRDGFVFTATSDGDVVREIADSVCLLPVGEQVFFRGSERPAEGGGCGEWPVFDDPAGCL